MKELAEMSLEELWQLFPIVLREHSPEYRQWFEEEHTDLAAIWGKSAPRISHIGSTAVPGLIAKPTVDILLELGGEIDPQEVIDRTSRAGWTPMSGAARRPLGLSFNKGYTPTGFAQKVFHLHVRPPGDHDELYFRDYLIEHPDTARDYERLKQSLRERFEHNRDAYTENKTDFIRSVTARARSLYPGRHTPSADEVRGSFS
ncbi:MAG: hypothetical protein QG608_3890 [Actinomycetota bacterium]|nr:hypothetical protein [Actinomycetota bacterium]